MTRTGTSKFIFCPMAEPDLGVLERGYINECIIDNNIGTGRFVHDFEDAWANYNKYREGVACNSGTNALYLAVKASGAKKILMPNFTMAGTAWAAMYDNLEITYIPTRLDVPLAKLPASVEGYDAIIFAHIYGRKAYPDGYVAKIKALNPKLIVIDDLAEAHGVMPEGDIACFSFYGNKILTTGEGGMCLTNDLVLAKEMRSLANMYFDTARSMIHPKVGHNFRMTNLQASIGMGQVERVEEILKKRSKIRAWYDKYMPEDVQLSPGETLWFYDIRVKNAEKLRYKLNKKGCDSRRFFYPMSLQPWGNQMPDPNALSWYKKGLLLPVYNNMIEGDVRWICQTVAEALK